MFATVVIPTCNRPEMLRACLRSVESALARTSRGDIEVLVTDDSADDRSRRLIAEQFPEVLWGRGPCKGPACNRNTGVRRARGAWIFFIDDDCIADPQWLTGYLSAIEANPGCCVLEGKTIADRARARIDEESPVNPTGGFLWSCNMAIRRQLFESLGGFCEAFPYAAMEDVDLRLRIQGLGEQFPFVAGAPVCHPYRRTKGLRFSVKQGRSYLYLIGRHPKLVSQMRWSIYFANLARRSKSLTTDAFRYRFRGFLFGAGNLLVDGYFGIMALLRYRRLRAS
jgi:GT2 family glycosyltransferase